MTAYTRGGCMTDPASRRWRDKRRTPASTSAVRGGRRVSVQVWCALAVLAVCAPNALGAGDGPPSPYDAAAAAMADGRPADAVPFLEAALEQADTAGDRARLQLLLGVALNWSGRYAEGIACLERVIAHDPRLVETYPEARIHKLSADVELGYAYAAVGDLETAITWWERCLEWTYPAPRVALRDIAARRKLGGAGALDAPAAVFAPGLRFIISRAAVDGQHLLVPPAKLAEALGLVCVLSENAQAVTLTVPEGPTVQLRAGSSVALMGGEERALEVAPEMIEGELWVPLRFTAEALGHTIEWEAAPRIAWVR